MIAMIEGDVREDREVLTEILKGIDLMIGIFLTEHHQTIVPAMEDLAVRGEMAIVITMIMIQVVEEDDVSDRAREELMMREEDKNLLPTDRLG